MRRTLFICLACAFALLVAPGIAPGAVGARAYAIGDYSIDELSTELTVQTDASVRVIERQTLTFSDANAGVTWYLHARESGESVRIASVRVAPVDDGGTQLGDWTRLQMVDSDPNKQGRNPGDTAAASLRTTKTQPWYSYNIGDGMMRCYFPTGRAALTSGETMKSPPVKASDGDEAADAESTGTDDGAKAGARTDAESEAEGGSADGTDTEGANANDTTAEGGNEDGFNTYLVETDYTILHRVRVFRDVGELYWRYAHDSLPADASHVSLQVVLPLPADIDPAAAAENVRAWGHGPGGTFAIGDNATVTYSVDEIARGNYAEAHVIFPANWLTDVHPGGANQYSELRGPAAISEESQWVDISLREAAWDNKVRLLFLGIALVVLLVGSLGAFRRGRTPLARRALIRTATTLGIIALAESLFFREPITTAMLAAFALVALIASLALPSRQESS